MTAYKGLSKSYVLWALAVRADAVALDVLLPLFLEKVKTIEKDADKNQGGALIFLTAYVEQQPKTKEIEHALLHLVNVFATLPENVQKEFARFTLLFGGSQ